MNFIFSFIIAYLLGSLSSAVLVAKFFKLPDPRSTGSKNAGATNMFRTSGSKVGLIVLIADMLKGLIAMIIAVLFHINGIAFGFVALGAVLGHIFPLFFGFKGGKGIATAAGALLAISLWTFIFVAITWVIVLLLARYVSLASILSCVAAPIYLLVGGNYVYFIPYALIAALIIWMHRDNISRLKQGTENKFQFSR